MPYFDSFLELLRCSDLRYMIKVTFFGTEPEKQTQMSENHALRGTGAKTVKRISGHFWWVR